MPKKNVIWCSHPKHDEVLANGKKKFWKTGPKPTHPKGKNILNKELIWFVNEYDERIINGTSRKLVAGDYFCTTCFNNEEKNFKLWQQNGDLHLLNSNFHGKVLSLGTGNMVDSPFDEDHIHIEQNHAKEKLDQVFRCFGLPIIEDM